MGARLNGIEEAEGSIPSGSTNNRIYSKKDFRGQCDFGSPS